MTDAELDKYRDDAAIMRMAASMKERGIEFEVKESKDPDTGEIRRAVIVTKVPEIEKAAMEFFTDRGIPIPGASKLKERYNKELELLNARSETGTCLPCQRGALIREYLPMVRKLIEANQKVREKVTESAIKTIEVTTTKKQEIKKDEQSADTGVVELPRVAEPSGEGTTKRENVLRRAKRYFEKVFSFGKRKTEE